MKNSELRKILNNYFLRIVVRYPVVFYLLFRGILPAQQAQAALFPPGWLAAVVDLGTVTEGRGANDLPSPVWNSAATGFLWAVPVVDSADPEKRIVRIVLATAGHVFDQFIQSSSGALFARVGSTTSGETSTPFAVPMTGPSGQPLWFRSKSADVAVTYLSFGTPGFPSKPHGFAPENICNKATMRSREVSAGDGIFVLGFPGPATTTPPKLTNSRYAVVRQGAIARIEQMLDGGEPTFLIDAFIFPGNSGGPVILRPEIGSIVGTKSQPSSCLLGLISSFLPYTDVAVSIQTKRPRVTFEENSGLANVVPVDAIAEAVSDLMKSNP